jgi:hypothetical protein
MGKYARVDSDIFSIFNSAAWKAESVPTFPSNFNGTVVGNEYIRLSVIHGGNAINKLSSTGMLNIEIFIPAGGGPIRASAIADALDGLLQEKSCAVGSAVTQFDRSNLTQLGRDPETPSLYRFLYTIPFKHFGVF